MLKQVMEMYELLDKAEASGHEVKHYLTAKGGEHIYIEKISGEGGTTDFIKVTIPGSSGKQSGGTAPTLGVIGRLGGLGARPEVIGFVSDGDGALAVLSVASKLIDMVRHGDRLKGDVIVTTHICPDAPTNPHYPVPFMGSYVDMETMNQLEVVPEMDVILSVDTTKGNKIINTRGFAISNTIKEGYILKVSDDLLEVMMRTTGRLPYVFPTSQQDITPYGNGLYHINSILQPATATKAPVVGVALTTEVPVAGCATGATHLYDIENACRFVVEVAKGIGEGTFNIYDSEEFERLKALYGEMNRFQTKGANL